MIQFRKFSTILRNYSFIQYRKIQVREDGRLLQSEMVETRINKVQDTKSHCNIPRLSLTARVQFRIS